MHRLTCRTLPLAGAVLLALSSHASAAEVSYSGFFSIVGGKVLSGENASYLNLDCPCYLADFPRVGFYTENWSFKPESNFGLQTNVKFDDKLSLTGQFMARGADDFDARIEWAYASYNLDNNWTVQAGRKRLPLFYYSDFLDMRFAYNWIRAPKDLYTWQITHYNGINALFRSNLGNWSLLANFWYGDEEDSNNKMLGSRAIYNQRIEENWTGIFGAYLDLSYDWLSMRFVYMHNTVDRYRFDNTGTRVPLSTGNPRVPMTGLEQDFFGASFNIDYGNFLLRSEVYTFDRPYTRPNDDNIYEAHMLGVGYRFGDVTPMITYSKFDESEAPYAERTIYQTLSYTVRWDFHSSAALKLQYDDYEDQSTFFFLGDSKSLALALDVVF